MKSKCLSLFFGLTSLVSAWGQDVFYYPNYQWKEAHSIEEFTGKSSFVIQDYRIVEFSPAEKSLMLYETVHKAVWINDDNTLEGFNKVFIPLGRGQELVRIDARTVKPSGEILEIDQENIKEMSNLEEYGAFKIFALEGAEIGGVVEYIYTVSEENEISGSEIIQETIPIADAQFILRAPQYLEFDVKTYNGLTEPKKYKNGMLMEWRSETTDLPPLYDELYATTRANQAKAAYRLQYNTNSYMPKMEIMSWVLVSNRFRELTYVEAPKGAKKLLKDLKLDRMKSEEDKIIAIDRYVKNNIAVKPDSGPAFSDIEDVLDRKNANELGMLRLYAALLTEAGIDYEVVISSNRYNARLDPEFPDFDILGELLIYFPQHGTYVNPDRLEYRYGFPAYTTVNNYALFLTRDNYRLDKIVPPSAEQNMVVHESNLEFTGDMSKVIVDKLNSWTGYRSFDMRAAYKYQDEEGRKLVTSGYVTNGIDDAVVTSFESKNMDMDDSAENKPLVYRTKFESSSLIENAGNLFLVNIGQIIGTQTELYQEHERTNPIEMDYPITYTHKIQFKIPSGYAVGGLEDGNFVKKCEVDGKLIAQFASTAKEENGVVTVEVLEFYKEVEFPKDKYEPFREVINAAADFNKLVLILEKE